MDALTRAAPVPAPLAAPTLAVLAMPESPGSLDAGLGRPEPVPGAATRDGGRSALPAAALGAPADAERATRTKRHLMSNLSIVLTLMSIIVAFRCALLLLKTLRVALRTIGQHFIDNDHGPHR